MKTVPIFNGVFTASTGKSCTDSRNCFNGIGIKAIKMITDRHSTGDLTESTVILPGLLPTSKLYSTPVTTKEQITEAISSGKFVYVDAISGEVSIFSRFPPVIYSGTEGSGFIFNRELISPFETKNIARSLSTPSQSKIAWVTVAAVIAFVIIVILIVLLIIYIKRNKSSRTSN